jgi:ribonuclease P protein component
MAWVRGPCLWVRRGRESRRQVFVVRRKLGSAVVRNRLKRRLRHICRNRPFLPRNLVILCQPPAVEAPFADLERELDYLVPKLSTT